MKRIASLTLVLMGSPIAAMAGGPMTPYSQPQVMRPAPMAPMTQLVDWTGGYVGLSLGAGHSYTNAPGKNANVGVAGVNLGYRSDMGPLVVGSELSLDKDNVNVGSASGSRVKSTAALKLIVGEGFGQTLLYGTIGVAQADATVAGRTGNDTGYTASIGADYALSSQTTIGGELATNGYNNFNNSGYDLQATTVKVKLGYKF